MIDIHTHIIPGIDDASQTMDASIKMARNAYENGVNTLIATPHCNIEGVFENYYDQSFVDRFLYLEEAIKKENIPLQLHLGMEVYATEEVPELLKKGKITTLNQSKYILIEFSFQKDSLLIEFLLQELVQLGYVPIIAHPERYPYVQKHPDMVYDWIEQGCYIQINKGSIMGNFGFSARNTAIYLLECKLASFVASDGHGATQRTTDLSRVYQYIKSRYTDKYAEVLFNENPRRVIDNKELIRPGRLRESEGSYLL